MNSKVVDMNDGKGTPVDFEAIVKALGLAPAPGGAQANSAAQAGRASGGTQRNPHGRSTEGNGGVHQGNVSVGTDDKGRQTMLPRVRADLTPDLPDNIHPRYVEFQHSDGKRYLLDRWKQNLDGTSPTYELGPNGQFSEAWSPRGPLIQEAEANNIFRQADANKKAQGAASGAGVGWSDAAQPMRRQAESGDTLQKVQEPTGKPRTR